MKTIRVGDTVPDFFLRDLDGNIYQIAEFLGKKQLVLIFYPHDGSNGCTNSVCMFHDISDYFDKDTFEIFGICGLPAEKIRDSSIIRELNFPIVSDHDNSIRKSFGLHPLIMGKYSKLFTLSFGLTTGRLTYVTDLQGKVIYTTDPRDVSKCQADEALKISFLLKKAR